MRKIIVASNIPKSSMITIANWEDGNIKFLSMHGEIHTKDDKKYIFCDIKNQDRIRGMRADMVIFHEIKDEQQNQVDELLFNVDPDRRCLVSYLSERR